MGKNRSKMLKNRIKNLIKTNLHIKRYLPTEMCSSTYRGRFRTASSDTHTHTHIHTNAETQTSFLIIKDNQNPSKNYFINIKIVYFLCERVLNPLT